MSANQPVLLSEIVGVWRVRSGAIDIFGVRMQQGSPTARREFLLRLMPDQAFVSFNEPFNNDLQSNKLALIAPGGDLTLIAVGDIGTEIEKLENSLEQLPAIDSWLQDLDRACHGSLEAWEASIAAAGSLQLDAGTKVVASPGQVLWAINRNGSLTTPEGQEIPPEAAAPPLTSYAPLTAIASLSLRFVTTTTMLEQEAIGKALPAHHKRMLVAFDKSIAIRNTERIAFDIRSEHATRASEAEGISNLAGVGREQSAAAIAPSAQSAWRAIAAVARALGTDITIPANLNAIELDDPGITGIAAACGLSCRKVILKSEWWLEDHGPLVAELTETNAPVAVLPDRGVYKIWNPASDTSAFVDAELGGSVQPAAFMLYRRFEAGQVTITRLLQFGMHRNSGRIALLMSLTLLGALLGLFVPWATGTLVDNVVPRSALRDLGFLAAGLIVVVISNASINLVRGLLLQQIEQQVDLSTQSALFDRTMRLPLQILKRYATGDLADRVLGLQAIRQQLTGAALSGALSGVMSLMNIGMMLIFSAKLALFGLVAATLSFSISLLLLLIQLRRERQLATSRGKAASIVLQLITGIAKLKASAAVGRAFSIWAKAYAQQRNHFVTVKWFISTQLIFQQTFMVLSTAALFYIAAGELALVPGNSTSKVNLGLGAFLGFASAFGQLLGGISGMVAAISGALSVIPIYERAMPLLKAQPESTFKQTYPNRLSGHIEFRNLTFRYPNTQAPVLQDLSFAIEPKETVAIIGPSGSGKSTVLRLLLGFECPEKGAVLYDGKPLSGLDIGGVRRQLGVVLQNSRVQPGSLIQNIAGGRDITLDDAWDAARNAGLDEDIKAMPMGMHTVLTDGGTTLSGGQRQRLMIARALVIKPRILLMDEATSALDNATQSIVTQAVSNLNLTRITIAHRLSSITSVDRVIVLDNGQIIQDGPFLDLLEQPGLFRELALLQLT